MNKDEKIANMVFGDIYPYYKEKIEKKGRSEDELLVIISWLTGYSDNEIIELIDKKVTFQEFFKIAKLNANANLITGSICWYRVEEIENKLTQKVRYLDKLIDELAKGKAVEKICRGKE